MFDRADFLVKDKPGNGMSGRTPEYSTKRFRTEVKMARDIPECMDASYIAADVRFYVCYIDDW